MVPVQRSTETRLGSPIEDEGRKKKRKLDDNLVGAKT
jgi:hypothetical protein